MSKPFKHDPQWAKAKKVCRLNQDDIQMAKQLGMKPKSLMKNNPSPSQQWKAPVRLWIRELHERRFGRGFRPVQNRSGLARTEEAVAQTKSLAGSADIAPGQPAPAGASAEPFDENIPF